MIWMAEAPVPMTATRLPVRSKSWFQRAEWKISPSNSSRPSMSGNAGSVSGPTAETTKFAVKVPCGGAHVPPRLLGVPAHLVNLAAEPVSVEHLVLSSDLLDVGLDFGLFGVRTGPLRFGANE